MAKRDRKVFRSVKFVEEVIENASGVIGTIRIKPSTVMWKPKNAKGGTPYYGVTIEDFENWITTTPHAKKMA